MALRVGSHCFSDGVDDAFKYTYIADFFVILYVLLNPRTSSAAFKGSAQWSLFSTVYAIKIIIAYAWADPCFLRDNMIGILVTMLIAPLVYAIMNFRAFAQLFGSVVGVVTIGSLLHADMILHVVMDLIDVSSAFTTVSLRCTSASVTVDPTAEGLSSSTTLAPGEEGDSVIYNLSSYLDAVISIVGVVIGIAIFFHGYSFAGEVDADQVDAVRSMLSEQAKRDAVRSAALEGDKQLRELRAQRERMRSTVPPGLLLTSGIGSTSGGAAVVDEQKDEDLEDDFRLVCASASEVLVAKQTSLHGDVEAETRRRHGMGAGMGASTAVTSRRASAIVSIFFVDGPLLIFRVYLIVVNLSKVFAGDNDDVVTQGLERKPTAWIKQGLGGAFFSSDDQSSLAALDAASVANSTVYMSMLPLFLLKNIVFFVLQIYRLHHARMAEADAEATSNAAANTRQLESALAKQSLLFDSLHREQQTKTDKHLGHDDTSTSQNLPASRMVTSPPQRPASDGTPLLTRTVEMSAAVPRPLDLTLDSVKLREGELFDSADSVVEYQPRTSVSGVRFAHDPRHGAPLMDDDEFEVPPLGVSQTLASSLAPTHVHHATTAHASAKKDMVEPTHYTSASDVVKAALGVKYHQHTVPRGSSEATLYAEAEKHGLSPLVLKRLAAKGVDLAELLAPEDEQSTNEMKRYIENKPPAGVFRRVMGWWHGQELPIFDEREIIRRNQPRVPPSFLTSRQVFLPNLPPPPNAAELRSLTGVDLETTSPSTPSTDASPEEGKTTNMMLRALLPLIAVIRSSREAAKCVVETPIENFPFFVRCRRAYASWSGLRGSAYPELLSHPIRLHRTFWLHSLWVCMVLSWLSEAVCMWYYSEPTRDVPVFSAAASSTSYITWNDIRPGEQTVIIIVGAQALLSVCGWAWWAPLLDVVLSVVLNVVRFMSTWVVFASLRDYTNLGGEHHILVMRCFIILPLLKVAPVVFPILSLVVGRHWLPFSISDSVALDHLTEYPLVTPSAPRTTNEVLVSSSTTQATHPSEADVRVRRSAQTADADAPPPVTIGRPSASVPRQREPASSSSSSNPVFDSNRKKSRAESGRTIHNSTAAIIVFVACRSSFAPAAVNQLLVGPDLMKALRMSDTLMQSSWWQLVMLVAIRVMSLAVFAENWVWVLFAGHFVLALAYHCDCQTIRILAIRRQELRDAYAASAASQIAELSRTLTTAERLQLLTELRNDQSSEMRRVGGNRSPDAIRADAALLSDLMSSPAGANWIYGGVRRQLPLSALSRLGSVGVFSPNIHGGVEEEAGDEEWFLKGEAVAPKWRSCINNQIIPSFI